MKAAEHSSHMTIPATGLVAATPSKFVRSAFLAAIIFMALTVAGILVWQGLTAKGAPDPTQAHNSPRVAVCDIGVLVFREGLECILVLSAITASMVGDKRIHKQPVIAGAGIGFVATL